ncbi:hypothetical protein RF11_00072 [Thelohanellus kitauei]|uniref:Tc1-like transposase DDE domain-containing protein n=1 Tax=Thelohanellus kitauei TaxID=669202 RepID=A0A0C2N367_THEKT|nr:hypothetical protein RF11_00072 [Thelohanellus kitauei]
MTESYIYIVETGVNLHTSTHHFGYAAIGLTQSTHEPANKGISMSLLVAISLYGVVHFKIQDGAINGKIFKICLMELVVIYSNLSSIYIMDNCWIPKSHTATSFVQNSSIRQGFLPSFSPQLNPIEEYSSRLKSAKVDENHKI